MSILLHMTDFVTKRSAVVLLAVLGVLVVVGAVAAARFRGPVLFRWTEGEETCTSLDFTVFNPRRDRAPEAEANQFLSLIKAGHCKEVMAQLSSPEERRSQVCPLEDSHPLLSWELRNRTDGPDQTELYYWIWHDGFKDHQMAWLIISKVGGRLRVTNYWCIC